MTDSPDALAAAVARWAAQRPTGTACTALSYRGGERTATVIDYRALHYAAGTLARQLRIDSAPGDRVAIACAHGLDYVVGFLACLYSARIAVPLFPIDTPRHADRLAVVLADAEPAVCLVSPGAEAATANSGAAVGHIVTVTSAAGHTAAEPLIDTAAEPLLDPVGTHPAYLQYTSGSTKAPAGVEVTHANLAAALEQLVTGLPITRERPMVTWLPFFHDMGLVFALSLPLYTGVPMVTLPPGDFAARPIRWLRACTDFDAGITASPNFGLTLAVSATTAQERAGLDLSGLAVLVNGAEPIRAQSLALFTETYAPHGFRGHAHTPGYGLAEATLPVCFGAAPSAPLVVDFDRTALTAGRALPTAAGTEPVTLVGCGTPAGQQVAIVDPLTGVRQPDGTVGEIWVAGRNICAGYFRRPRDTATTFGARIPGSTESWLRTGDLGFVHGGEIFIAGRRTDMIVIDGRNHYPADIEATAAAAAPQLRTGHIVAFGHDRGDRETLILVAELTEAELAEAEAGLTTITRRITAAVTTAHDIAPAEVIFVRRGQIPKTSSGKLRRGECRVRYRDGGLRRVTPAPDRSDD